MPRTLDGRAASPGTGVGRAFVLGVVAIDPDAVIAPDRRSGEDRVARAALKRAAEDILAVAGALREGGRSQEAEIVETGALLARDPALQSAVSSLVLETGRPAAAAIVEAAEAHAAAIAGLEDPLLAERADDIRSVGRRAAALIEPAAGERQETNGSLQVLVAPDVGPADVAQLESTIAGIALAAGGVSAHAAIVARSLGIPMVVGVGEGLNDVAGGDQLVIDGTAGRVIVGPEHPDVEAARREVAQRAQQRERSRVTRELPATTADGRAIRVLANVAGTAEVDAGLEAGAEGVGLLRTELAYLDSRDWPTEQQHRALLAPILGRLAGRIATVRVLDFGGDKTPPFLSGDRRRGIALLLEHPDALEAQLRAILAVSGSAKLRVLLPLVESVREIDLARLALLRAAEDLPGSSIPALGAMIETRAGVEAVERIAENVEFLSIGTNDLTHSVLDRDRFAGDLALPHHPAVLHAIAVTVWAGKSAGIPVDVCGEAASSPISAPLLIGAGVDELSVGAARVGAVRNWVRSLSYDELRAMEGAARGLASPAAVETLVADVARRLELLERGDAGAERAERTVGVDPVSA
jgi:phosphoenolpyruvate-protein kinase (PTS system EI component)